MLGLNVDSLKETATAYDVFRTVGKLRSAGSLLTARLNAAIGEVCEIETSPGTTQLAEVIGLKNGIANILPFEPIHGVTLDSKVTCLNQALEVPCGLELLGRVVDGLGRPMDGKGPLRSYQFVEVGNSVPSPMARQSIKKPFVTGQRVVDGLLTLGQGQRVGLFAGSGIGKSTLLGEIAKGAESDVNVVALIGERGREVKPFLEDCLGQQGLKKSICVVSTADQPPLMRVRAAQTAVAISSHFRSQGANVLMLLDSTTRIAMAQREIGQLLNEVPGPRGYTPSVFGLLSSLLEQLGASDQGTTTGIITVLVDGDDMDEPISDAVRGIVDGHIVMDRKLAEKGFFPAIDVGRSISRVFRDVTTTEQQDAAAKCRHVEATFNDVSELIRIGAYQTGADPKTDTARKLMEALNAFKSQSVGEHTSMHDTVATLKQIAGRWPYKAYE